MDPNQQPTAPQEETPTTPTLETPVETPQTPEAPASTPSESVPVENPTPEVPVAPEVTPAETTPAPAAPTSDPAAAPVVAPQASGTSLSTANPGFAFGLTSLILSLLSIGLFAVIFGILGLRKSQKAGQGNGLAIAGLIIGGIEVLFGLVAVIFILIALPNLNFSER